VKLSEGSRRKRRTPFLREEAEGRPSFGRKPKDGNKFASFGFLRKAATPPEVKLSEGSRASFRKPKDGNKFIKPKDALFSKQV